MKRWPLLGRARHWLSHIRGVSTPLGGLSWTDGSEAEKRSDTPVIDTSPRIVIEPNRVSLSSPMYSQSGVLERQPSYQYHLTDILFYNRPEVPSNESTAQYVSARISLEDGRGYELFWINPDRTNPDDVGPTGHTLPAVPIPAGQIPAKIALLAKREDDLEGFVFHQKHPMDPKRKLSAGPHRITIKLTGGNFSEVKFSYRLTIGQEGEIPIEFLGRS